MRECSSTGAIFRWVWTPSLSTRSRVTTLITEKKEDLPEALDCRLLFLYQYTVEFSSFNLSYICWADLSGNSTCFMLVLGSLLKRNYRSLRYLNIGKTQHYTCVFFLCKKHLNFFKVPLLQPPFLYGLLLLPTPWFNAFEKKVSWWKSWVI